VAERPEAEGGALDSLDEVIGCLGGTVGQLLGVPGDNVALPPLEGASQGADLGWLVLAGHVDDQLVDPLGGEFGVGVGVDLAHGLLSVNRPWLTLVGQREMEHHFEADEVDTRW
jgi:hypothetical protein